MRDLQMVDDVALAELIGSRLCHDLINPLGAIGNGVELLEMTGSTNGPELELIRDAVVDAQARIRFFRVAFGAAEAQQILSNRDAKAAVDDLFRSTRLNPLWDIKDDLPRRQAKLGFLLLLCAETALPMGGSLTIGHQGNGHWHLVADGPRINLDEELWSVVRYGRSVMNRPMRPAEVHFAALHAHAETMDLTVNYIADEAQLRMTTT